jgi:uncharacterized membrane protein YfcA
VIYFGIPGMFGTYVGSWLGGIASEVLQLVVFGFVLIAAAYSMLRKPHLNGQASSQKDMAPQNMSAPNMSAPNMPAPNMPAQNTPVQNMPAQNTPVQNTPAQGKLSDDAETAPYSLPIPLIALEGIVVGILTGFVGVGGGFLIVPALVIFGHLPMRLAIGTSLVIIAAKSAVGFVKYQGYLLDHQLSVDVQTIVIFTLVGIIGSLLGRAINQRLNQQVLKRVFAVFLVLLGGFVIIFEGSKFLSHPQPKPAVVQIHFMNR